MHNLLASKHLTTLSIYIQSRATIRTVLLIIYIVHLVYHNMHIEQQYHDKCTARMYTYNYYFYIRFVFIHYLCSTTSRTRVSVPLLLVGDKPFRIGLTLLGPDTSYIFYMFKPTRCKRKCVAYGGGGEGEGQDAEKKEKKKTHRGCLI